jgi:hypothetical protein
VAAWLAIFTARMGGDLVGLAIAIAGREDGRPVIIWV